jgi:DNA-binding beta-propeller fold protein YncE
MFKCPACVTVHEDKVIVSDWGNHRVQIFTLDGKFLKQIGKQGNGPSEFKRPLGVAVDEKGNIAIVDEGNNRLQIFRSDFSYFSKVTGLKLEFQRPWDVAITRNGGIVVSEYYGHRLQIL